MPSIANIPEPTSAYRPIDTDQPIEHAPLGVRPTMESASSGRERESDEQSIVSWMMVIVGGGLLMRVGMLYFGALREVPTAAIAPWHDLGQSLMQDPAAAQTAWPVFALLAAGTEQLGLPGWFVVLIGLLLTAAAIPATYALGKHLTGSVTAGLIASAVVGFHPAALAAAGVYGPMAFSLALTVIGLSLIALASQRGPAAALSGAIVLGIAVLTAPLAWAVVPLAGVLAGQAQSIRVGLARAVLVLAIVTGPAIGWFALTGQNPLLPANSLSAWPAAGSVPAVAETAQAGFSEKMLYAAGNHSLPQLGQALHAQIIGDGPLTRTLNPNLTGLAQPDAVADTIGDGWVVLNLILLLAAAASAAVMALRGRGVLALALTLPLLALILSSPLLGESGRVGMLGVQAALALGFLAARPAARYTEQELAEREAIQLARREAKEQARLAKIEKKSLSKADIYAFDKNDRRKPAERRSDLSRAGAADRRKDPAVTVITSERTLDDAAPMGRPI